MDVVINVVDEDPSVADVLSAVLDSYGFVTRKHPNVESLIDALSDQARSISLISLELPKRGARRFLTAIQDDGIPTIAVMMNGGAETSDIVDAIKAGAEEVIEKPLSINELLSVLESSISKVNAIAPSQISNSPTLYDVLTTEEKSILELLEKGTTIKGIAAELDISVRTVHYRKKSIFTKTDCKNSTEAVAKLSSSRSRAARPDAMPHNRALA
jgi:DNA-binding NarL/FixJ family response regulator